MRRINLGRFCFYVYLCISNSAYKIRVSCKQDGSFYKLTRGYFLNSVPIVELQTIDSLECVLECLAYDGCKTVNVNKYASGFHICKLLAEEVVGFSGKLIEKEGWDFYEVTNCEVREFLFSGLHVSIKIRYWCRVNRMVLLQTYSQLFSE